MTNQGNDQSSGIVLAYLVISILALIALGLGIASFTQQISSIFVLGLIAVMVPFVVYILGRKMESGSRGQAAPAPGSSSSQEDMLVLLRSINERLMFSDRAKQVSYRSKDRALMRKAIEEDLANGEYDAALVLIDQMANLYGYRVEAEQFRQQVLEVQQAKIKEMLANASTHIEEICKTGEFDKAQAEVERLKRLYPNAPQVRRLPLIIEKSLNNYKRNIEREFLRASEIGDVERAMALIKEMDRFLTPEEAEPYIEIARGVIGQAKENLGVQFRMRVQDHDWIGAYQIGQMIIKEFPNSKFAIDVRKMLDSIRANAAQQQQILQAGGDPQLISKRMAAQRAQEQASKQKAAEEQAVADQQAMEDEADKQAERLQAVASTETSEETTSEEVASPSTPAPESTAAPADEVEKKD